MTSWTAAYFVRLVFWWIAASAVLAAPIWSSWQRSARRLDRGQIATSYELTCSQFAALAALPTLVIVAIHSTLGAMGSEIMRGSPESAADASRRLQDFLATTVTVVWLVGAGTSLFWLGRDLLRLRRLGAQLGPAPPALSLEIDELIAAWPHRSRLLARTGGATPFVMGLLKPIVVAPDSLMTMPAAQRRAILLHELAHVVRRDYAANLVQRLLLALLWFNPAAWWLYRRLHREREACCDRLAIARGASPTALAEALIWIAEDGPAASTLMAMSGGADLSWRIGHVLGYDDVAMLKAAQPRRGGNALVALAGVCACTMTGIMLGKADPGLPDRYIASIFGPIVAVRAHDPAGSFALRIRQGRVIQASVGQVLLKRTDIVQRGDRVILVNDLPQSALSLRVSAAGRIDWRARARR